MHQEPPVVESYNEWDPLEEVIVGSVRGAARMAYEPAMAAYVALGSHERAASGGRFAAEEIERAEAQLDGLARLLEARGVVVRRPTPLDHAHPIRTPDFAVPCGNSSACPRDVLLVVGDEIIEAPMAQRGRYFDFRAYRSLVQGYFRQGARWTAAPKPLMSDALYHLDYTVEQEPFDADRHPSLTEAEPCFDAASFTRLGWDIFYQPDLVTNDFGAQWLQRHLGPTYRLHRVRFRDERPPQHLDATLVPLRPGLLLVNPMRPCLDDTLDFFSASGWRVVEAPPPAQGMVDHSHEVSGWISMNLLVLDPGTVLVEEREAPLIALLESLDFTVLTVPFAAVYPFGGGLHCCTVDIRRRGPLQSYFGTAG